MRVTDQAFFNNAISSIQRLQASLNDLQEQVATGRRIQRPSDDPVGASRLLDYRASIDTLAQYQRNASLGESRLRLEEQTLSDFTALLQRAREVTLQAANATQSPETRGFIAEELAQSLDQALALANTRDATDEFLFSGFQTSTQPYTRTASGFQYNGDQGQRFLQISSSRQVADSDPGDAIFGRIREGNGQILATAASANTGTGVILTDTTAPIDSYNYERYAINFTSPTDYQLEDEFGAVIATGTYTSGDSIDVAGFSVTINGEPGAGDVFELGPSPNTDVFSIVQGLVDSLRSATDTPAGRAVVENDINRGLYGLDQAINRVLEARTSVGARLGAVESQIDTNSGTEIVLQRSLAEIEDLDYADAISQLSAQTTALEAAQQSFVRVQSLSLFNFL